MEAADAGLRFGNLADADGNVRTHGATDGAYDAISRACLIGGKITQAVDLIGKFEHLFGAYHHAQAASFTSIHFNLITIGHAFVLL
jgi:hypothetical protein